jgi:hypothetical protein
LLAEQQAPELPGAWSLLAEQQAPELACLFKQKKHKKKKTKKVSILPDRGCMGLVGARASAPTPQQQLHSINSTARASAPQVELW